MSELTANEQCVVLNALGILEKHVNTSADVFDDATMLRSYLALRTGHLPHEVFSVLFLNAQHKLIAMEEMFRGSITQTSVYPREVVKRALHHNAATVVLTHNHPSGNTQPSSADIQLTQHLKTVLALIDVRVLDHVIVGGGNSLSMAERGLL